MTDEIRFVKDFATLEANVDCGEGSIRMTDEFWSQNETWQLDVVGDWITQLRNLYDNVHEKLYGEDTDTTVQEIMGHDTPPWEDPEDPNLEGRN
jgi:hypothetical protein